MSDSNDTPEDLGDVPLATQPDEHKQVQQRGGVVCFTVTIIARLKNIEGGKPSFRFKFVDGNTFSTAPLGGDNWLKSESQEEEKTAEEIVQQESSIKEYFSYTWRQKMSPITANKSFAVGLNSNPFVTFFITDKNGTNYWHSPITLDLSVFLCGDVKVSQRLVSPEVAQNVGGTIALCPEGFDELQFEVTSDKILLDKKLEHELNPLSITINKVTNLPGAALDINSKKEREFADGRNWTIGNGYEKMPFSSGIFAKSTPVLALIENGWQRARVVACVTKKALQPLVSKPRPKRGGDASDGFLHPKEGNKKPPVPYYEVELEERHGLITGIRVGSKVQARFKGRSEWTTATIRAINLDKTLFLEYFDGDIEKSAAPDYVRPFRYYVSAEKVVQPNYFAMLNHLCHPAYVMFQFFDGDDIPRIIRTPGAVQHQKLFLNHKTVFLTGLIDKHKLYQLFNASKIEVEFHDRDMYESDADSKIQQEKWEAKVRGCEEITGDDGIIQERKNPIDIFSVDEIFMEEYRGKLLAKGDFFTHGMASFRLDGLLNRANEVQQTFAQKSAGGKKVLINQKNIVYLKSDIACRKRRKLPKGAQKIAEWDMSEEERLCRRPAQYSQSNCRISLTAELNRPIHTSVKPLDEPPLPQFERIVFVFPYDHAQKLQKIREIIDSINQAALPGVSLRTYQLSDLEMKRADMHDANQTSDHESSDIEPLDIVTGFQVVDDSFRLIVIEGIADSGMKLFREKFPRSCANTPDSKTFSDSKVRFTKRMYTSFHVDLKMIRLRDPLPVIVKNPDIYNRSKISEECFQTMHKMMEIRKANRLRTLQIMDLFPKVHGLEEIENKYGETITLEDMLGVKEKPRKTKSVLNAFSKAGGENEKNAPVASALMIASKMKSKLAKVRRKAATDQSNQQYIDFLANRKEEDYLTAHVTKAAALKKIIKAKKQKEFDEAKLDPTPIYIYSSQKRRSLIEAQREFREKIAKEKNTLYTYSSEFVSATIAPVDPIEIYKEQDLEEKKKQLTDTGFRYPQPKDPSEYNIHPKRPSQFAIEKLREPWEGSRKNNSPTNARGSANDPLILTPNGFDTKPCTSKIFGLVDPITKKQDPNFFKSVHLGGDEEVEILEAKRKREKEIWRSKVVVDSEHMVRHYSKKKETQVDRLQGILDGQSHIKSLPDDQIPALLPRDAYIDAYKANLGTRESDKSKWVSKNQFTTVISKKFGKSKLDNIKSTRPIAPIHKSERKGPKWSSS